MGGLERGPWPGDSRERRPRERLTLWNRLGGDAGPDGDEAQLGGELPGAGLGEDSHPAVFLPDPSEPPRAELDAVRVGPLVALEDQEDESPRGGGPPLADR